MLLLKFVIVVLFVTLWHVGVSVGEKNYGNEMTKETSDGNKRWHLRTTKPPNAIRDPHQKRRNYLKNKMRMKREAMADETVFGYLKLEEDASDSNRELLDRTALLESLLSLKNSRRRANCGSKNDTTGPQDEGCDNNEGVLESSGYYDLRNRWEDGKQSADIIGDAFWHARMETCPSHYSCLTPDSILNSQEDEFNRRRDCLCMRECKVYGNCCLDYPIGKIHNYTIKSKRWSCTTVNDHQAYYVISTCPSKWTNEHVRNQCEVGAFNASDKFLKIPVTSKDTLLTYHNVFCAVCNRDFNASFWHAELRCPDRTETSFALQSDISGCSVQFKTPKLVLQSGNETTKTLPTVPLISCDANLVSVCASDWMVTHDYSEYALEVATKCALVYAPVNKMSFYEMIKYKNKYCAICNGVKGEDLLCPLFKSAPEMPSGKSALPLLLDMDFSQGGTIVGSQERCPQMHVYDPWRKECRSVICSADHVFTEGRCVPTLRDGNKVLRAVLDANESFTSSCAKVSFIEQEVEIFENGTIIIVSDGTSLEPGQYEYAENSTITVCLPPDLNIYVATFTNVQDWLTMVGICVSVVALIIKIALSLFSKERKKVSSRIVLFLSMSLSTAQLLFILGISRTQQPVLCKVIGIVMHYCFLSSFFWMNVLAFDIWKTFASSMSILKAKLATKQLLYYSIYGWLTPAFIVLLSVLANWFIPYPILKPQYGVAICWFSNKISLTIFFGVPLAILLLANAIFFVVTAIEIRRTTVTAKDVVEKSTKRKDHVQFGLYCKLACIMGLTWLFGFVAAYAGSSVLWYLFIIFNSIQGVYVLVAFTHFRTPDWLKPGKLIKTRYTSSSRSSLTATSSLPKF